MHPSDMTYPGLKERLWANEEAGALEAYLDGLTHPGRLQQLYRLARRDQAALWERVAGQGCVLRRDFVPEQTPALQQVIHHGKNSLPLFNRFEKRFCLPRTPALPPEVIGYNEQRMRPFTGPGYFRAREAQAESGVQTVVIDYTLDLPVEKPEAWPPIRSNRSGLSRFIYYGTTDWMWRVSQHFTIGRTRKASGWMDVWFVLCRQ